MGPIPPFFETLDGELAIGGQRVSALIEAAGGTPLFVYDTKVIRHQAASFRKAFGDVRLHYAMKANPHPDILRAIAPLVDGFDVASRGEIDTAILAGIDPTTISFAGPGKRDTDIQTALRNDVVINCESAHQIERALELGRAVGVRPRLALRVNPDFEIKGSGMRMGGGAKPFGIDADQVPALCKRLIADGAQWHGLHVYSGSQALDPQALIDSQKATLALASRIAEQVGASPRHVNLGGGFGIPYFPNDQRLDIASIGAALSREIELARQGELKGTEFAIELGRWLVGECGVYLTRIIDRKTSRGEVFLVTDGGMQHQLAASGNFGQVIRRNYPVAIATRMADAPDEVVNVVGCLCTPLDKLGEAVVLPEAQIGDVVAVFVAGAYGLTASPSAFLSQDQAREMVIQG